MPETSTHPTAAASATKEKILWLSIVQGWAILLVVVGHVNCYTYAAEGEMYGLSTWVTRLCYAFHMPLFMFVSGGLLYYSRLAKGWSAKAVYADKFKRLVLPYLFFILLAMVLKGVLGGYSKRGAVDISLPTYLSALFNPSEGPLAEMWFVATLLWFMVMYPLFRWSMRNQYLEMGLLAVTLLPFIAGMPWDTNGWFNLGGVPRYAFYFFGGMLFFKYRLYRYARGRVWVAAVLTGLFLACVFAQRDGSAFTATAGILMSVAWGVIAEERFPRLFSSFRDYSFQIFLIGIFPQMFLELFLWRRFPYEGLQIPFYIISCCAALMTAVIVSKCVKRIPSRIARRFFGLK